MRKLLALFILGLVFLAGLFLLRGNEDTWICENNIWVKHGHPANPVPTTGCGETKTLSVNEVMLQALSTKHNLPPSSLIVATTIDTGSFAKGTVNFKDGGGGLWFAVKTDKGWELAFDGNGIVDCAIVNNYNFPKDMVPSCIDTANGNQFVQR